MITEQTKSYSKKQIYKTLHPWVRQWFDETFEDFTPAQKKSIVDIHKGNNILVSSPTYLNVYKSIRGSPNVCYVHGEEIVSPSLVPSNKVDRYNLQHTHCDFLFTPFYSLFPPFYHALSSYVHKL